MGFARGGDLSPGTPKHLRRNGIANRSQQAHDVQTAAPAAAVDPCIDDVLRPVLEEAAASVSTGVRLGVISVSSNDVSKPSSCGLVKLALPRSSATVVESGLPRPLASPPSTQPSLPACMLDLVGTQGTAVGALGYRRTLPRNAAPRRQVCASLRGVPAPMAWWWWACGTVHCLND